MTSLISKSKTMLSVFMRFFILFFLICLICESIKYHEPYEICHCFVYNKSFAEGYGPRAIFRCDRTIKPGDGLPCRRYVVEKFRNFRRFKDPPSMIPQQARGIGLIILLKIFLYSY